VYCVCREERPLFYSHRRRRNEQRGDELNGLCIHFPLSQSVSASRVTVQILSSHV
jgi:hypothetical protein